MSTPSRVNQSVRVLPVQFSSVSDNLELCVTIYCCSVSLCNCESAPPTLSRNFSTPLYIRWELGLLGARWLLPEVVVFSGISSWSVHFQCRNGSSFKILRGLNLLNISRQGGGKLFPTYKHCKYLISKLEGGGGGGT